MDGDGGDEGGGEAAAAARSAVCAGRGACVGGECKCEQGYEGRDCTQRRCPGDCSRRGVCRHGACYCFPGADGADCALDSVTLDTTHPPAAATTTAAATATAATTAAATAAAAAAAAAPFSAATVVSPPRPGSPRSWLERARLAEAAAAASAAATARGGAPPPTLATSVAPAPESDSYARDQITAILNAHSAAAAGRTTRDELDFGGARHAGGHSLVSAGSRGAGVVDGGFERGVAMVEPES